MQRDMSFELDDAFADRNSGELICTQPTKTKVLRVPGLTVVTDGSVEDIDVVPTTDLTPPMDEAESGLPTVPADVMGLGSEITLPLVGKINVGTLLIGVAVGAAAVWFLRKK